MPEGSLDLDALEQVRRPVSARRSAGVETGDWRGRLQEREQAAWESLRQIGDQPRYHLSGSITYILADAIRFLADVPPASLHAIVTDPPFGFEYEDKDHDKLRSGRGGVWRIPPSFDGAKRKPVPRFTVLSDAELSRLSAFFGDFARRALPALVPGGHLFIASSPLLSSAIFHAIQEAGFEKRGEIIRLVQTLRGGYKPKGAETDFPSFRLCRVLAGSRGASSASRLTGPSLTI